MWHHLDESLIDLICQVQKYKSAENDASNFCHNSDKSNGLSWAGAPVIGGDSYSEGHMFES